MISHHVWIVEMLEADDIWCPTVGVGIIRDHGLEALRRWRATNPDDRFRLTRYEPAPKSKRPARRGGK